MEAAASKESSSKRRRVAAEPTEPTVGSDGSVGSAASAASDGSVGPVGSASDSADSASDSEVDALDALAEQALNELAPGWRTVFAPNSAEVLTAFWTEWQGAQQPAADAAVADAAAAETQLQKFVYLVGELALDVDVAALLSDDVAPERAQAAGQRVRGRRLRPRALRCSATCECLATFRECFGSEYDTITARADALVLATAQADTKRKDDAAQKTTSQFKGPKGAAKGAAKRERGGATKPGTSRPPNEEPQSTQEDKDAELEAVMTKWLEKRSKQRVAHRGARERYDEFVCSQAQHLAEVRLPDREEPGLCSRAREIITRTSNNYWRKPLASLGERSRLQVLGLAKRARGSKLRWAEIQSSDDLPVCCMANCLRHRLHFKHVQRLAEVSAQANSDAEAHALLRQVVRETPGLCGSALQLLLGASDKVSARAKEDAVMLRLEGLESERRHGNEAREPANRLGEAERVSIRTFLDTVTWHQPDGSRGRDGKGLRIATSEDVEGLSRMWRAFGKMMPEVAEEMTETTFGTYIEYWLAIEVRAP